MSLPYETSEPGEGKTLAEKLKERFPEIVNTDCFLTNFMKKIEEKIVDDSNWVINDRCEIMFHYTISNEEKNFIVVKALLSKVIDKLKSLAEKHNIIALSPCEEKGKLWIKINEENRYVWTQWPNGNVFEFKFE